MYFYKQEAGNSSEAILYITGAPSKHLSLRKDLEII